MNKNRFKLICLDLDGTLLNSKHRISEMSMKVLRQAERKGIKIAIVTGRAAYDAKYYAKMISNNAYFIGANGAIVGNVADNTIISEKTFSMKNLNILMKIVELQGLKPVLMTINKIYINGVIDYLIHLYHLMLLKNKQKDHFAFIPNKKQLKKILKEKDRKIHKAIFFIFNKNRRKKNEQIFRNSKELEIAVTSKVCFEVTEKGINKSYGIRKLIEHLGIDKSEVIAFGDSENDLKMLKYVGFGVAMGNATKHIKSIADYITETNDNEGIALVLKDIIGIVKM